MSWALVVAIVLLSWFAIALVIGTIVGFGIASGTGRDSKQHVSADRVPRDGS